MKKKQLLTMILSVSMVVGTSVGTGTVSFAKESVSDIQEVQEEINQNHSDEAEERDAEASQTSEEPGEGNALETEKEALSKEQKASDEVETQAQGTTIYVDGDNANNGGIGDDSNSGLTKDKPVKTLKKAAHLAAKNGTIILLRNVFIREDTVLDNNVTVKRGGECSVGMIYLGQASLTVNNATIDGNKTEYPNGHPLIVIYNNPTLTINDGAKLCNNNGNVIEQVSMSSSDQVGPEVIMNGGEICDNVIEQDKTNSKATIYMAQRAGNLKIKGGSIHDNQAGGIDLTIPGFEMTGGEIYNNNTTSTTARYGGIYVRGSNAVISGGKIYGNTSTYGGGINVSGQGDLTITGTALIENNSAEYGAGVFVEYGKLDMQGGTIRNNKDAVFGGGIFLWNQDSGETVPKLKCRASVSGGTIEGNTAKYGNGIAFYEDTGTGYPILELSGSPDIKDAIYLNDSQDMEAKVSVTGALTLKQPVPIYDSKWTDNRVIVSYAPGLTAKKADFVKYAKTSTQDIKLAGQDLQSINVQPQTFNVVFKEQDGSREYRTIQVEENGKIDQTQVPTVARDGYTLTGWKSAASTWDFANDAVTGRTELYPVWKLNAPQVTLGAENNITTVHIGDTVKLTAQATHEAEGNITYQFQWFKDGEEIKAKAMARAVSDTSELVVDESGEYSVKVLASDGAQTAEAVAGSVSVTVTPHQFGGDWKHDAKDHWHECTIENCGVKDQVEAHIFSEWTVVKPATTKEQGEKERTCTTCGYKETEKIPMTENEAPVISAKDKDITVGDTFDVKADVKATDKEDGDLTDKIEVVKNTVDTSKAGTYEVTYQVTDTDGATTTLTIKIVVKEKAADVPKDDPKDSDTTKETKVITEKTPRTGDETRTGVILLGFVAGVAGIVETLRRKKRTNN